MNNYDAASREIDRIHSLDPNKELVEGKEFPSELIYSNRMSEILLWFAPDASENVKLAAKCQHFRRWEIPRNKYPMDKKGYHSWRNELFAYQANEVSKVLLKFGFDKDNIEHITSMIRKAGLKISPNTQLIEDIACMVFFKYYASNFSQKHTISKVKFIVQRTLAKMSQVARIKLLDLDLNNNVKGLIES